MAVWIPLRARAGDRVVLLPGRYEQEFRSVRSGEPGRPIRITGSAAAQAAGAGKDRVIEIGHDHFELSGFTVTGLAGDLREEIRIRRQSDE